MRAPEFWDRKTNGWLPTLLRPLGCLMATATALRIRSAKPYRAPVPVICVGNLVAGGAGKTPVADDIAHRLTAAGKDPHIVSRGYGGRELGPLRVDPDRHTALDVGDEALLLATRHPTWVSRERADGVQAAVEAGAKTIIMDDGFQNPTVQKDLSILVVDGQYGFGNARVMPAGPLREPIESGLKRTDAVVLMGADDADVWGRVRRAGFKDLPVLRARLEPTGDALDLSGRDVYAFAGIGRPEKFFATLTAMGCKLAGCKAFDDHHPFEAAEIDAILADAGGVTCVTTAKDWIRLTPEHRERIHRVDVALAWKQPDELDALLARLMEPHGDAHG